jgi:glyceraldehyde 3-phosphate dehydrogenase
MGVKVAINGFGRTGRLTLRAALEKRSDLDFIAVNRGTPEILGHLLKYDSVHGKLPFKVEIKKNSILVDNHPINVFYESDAEKLPWDELGVDLVIETSDRYRTREGASKHLSAGAKKVLIGAPGKNPDATIVLGVNDDILDKEKHLIVSNASCTTNCIAPVAKILEENWGIEHGFMTTIHAYTNSQVILDKSHKDPRRGRAAAMNIIPTTTGATNAVGLVLPTLAGKLDGMAYRVPVPDASLVDLVVKLKKGANSEEINSTFKAESEGGLKGILGYSTEPLVSSDYIHCSYSSVFDSLETRVKGNLAKILAWYDNEWGYCCRIVDLAEKMF